jgi:ribonuclease E
VPREQKDGREPRE